MTDNPEQVHVGDIVVDARMAEGTAGVIVEVAPLIQVSLIHEDTGSDTGLILGPHGGAALPITVLGSLPLEEVASGLANSRSIFLKGHGYQKFLNRLLKAAVGNPADVHESQ